MPHRKSYIASLNLDEAFECALDRFIAARLDVFTPKDALEAMKQPCTEENIGSVYDLLSSSALVFRVRYDSDRGNSQWISRAGIFQGKEFAVKVSKLEIASGIFIPGLRCAVFANPLVPTRDYRFYIGRKRLAQTVVDVTLDEVLPFYALAGEEFAPQFVAKDSEEGPDPGVQRVAEFAEGGGDLPLKVVDMREFYWQHQVKPGDYLVFKVANWRNPRFLLRLRKQNEERLGVASWREAFWQLLKESFEDLGPWVSIENQVSNAFFLGYNKEIFSLPPDDILNAIELSPDIAFLPFGMETRLWKEGLEYPIHENWEAWLEDVLCSDDTDIFESTKFPVLPEVLYAYVQDALWRGEQQPLPLLNRLCEANGGKTVKAFRSELLEFLSQVYGALEDSYNIFADTAAGKRSRFLDYYTRIVSLARFCQAAGAEPVKLNDQFVLILTQLAEHVSDCLRVLCYSLRGFAPDGLPPDDSIEGMDDILSSLEDSLKIAAENYRSSKKRG